MKLIELDPLLRVVPTYVPRKPAGPLVIEVLLSGIPLTITSAVPAERVVSLVQSGPWPIRIVPESFQTNQSLTLLGPIAAGDFVVSVVATDNSVKPVGTTLVPSYHRI